MPHSSLWNTECSGAPSAVEHRVLCNIEDPGRQRPAVCVHRRQPAAGSWLASIGLRLAVAGWLFAVGCRWSRCTDGGDGEHLLTRTVVSWNTMISTCEKGMQWDSDLGLLQEMVQHMRAPNVESWKVAKSALEGIAGNNADARRDSSGRESLDWAKRFHKRWQRMW